MISRDFVKLWEPQYDTQKFPVDFYLSHIARARNANKPEQLREDLRALLHWKDGKAVDFVPGEDHAKPNTLNPVITTAKPGTSPIREVGPVRNSPNFWGQQVPETGVIPPACNVLKALQEYLALGSFETLPQYKKQNLRDLQFHKFQQSHLHELLQEPGGNIAGQLLQYYKEKMGGGVDISRLPRPILDVFLVGWASICGIHGAAKMAIHLHASGFGGTPKAAAAAVSVGKTTGRLFGLIDDSSAPTPLFHKYFGGV